MNGTRLVFLDLVGPLASFCNPSKNEIVYLPKCEFTMQASIAKHQVIRLQYPIRVAFAVTLNKSQGRTLERAVLVIDTPAFSHGQLYVAMSRVKDSGSIALFTSNIPFPKTMVNVVYNELISEASKGIHPSS